MKDAAGATVGTLVAPSIALRDVGGGVLVGLQVANGQLGAHGEVYFESFNCTGTAYPSIFEVPPVAMTPATAVVGTTLYYQTGPMITVPLVQSRATSCSQGGTPLPPGHCCLPYNGSGGLALPSASVDLSALVPPFHIDVP